MRKKKCFISAYIDVELRKKLRVHAAMREMSMSRFIEQAVRKEIAQGETQA